MKKVLVGLFYTLQGLIHLWLFFIIRVVGSPGAPGGVLYGLEIIIRSYFVLVSCFSLLTTLILFLRRENWALVFGVVSSVLFGLFYGFLVILQAPIFIFVRLLCLVIVILNAVSVFFLYDLSKNKGIQD